MRRMAMIGMILALGMPSLAWAQSAPITGPNSGAVHGQNWNMRQDLHSPTQPGAPPQTRSQRLRQQAREAEARRRAQAQQQQRQRQQQRQQQQRQQQQRSGQNQSAAPR